MDIQSTIDMVNDQHATACEPGQWSLGMLVDYLEQHEPGITVGLSSELISYRGYYNHLCIEPGESTAGELLKRLHDALNGEVFEGYKGGDYTYTRKTPVWVAEYGDCGPYLSGFTMGVNGLTPKLTEDE